MGSGSVAINGKRVPSDLPADNCQTGVHERDIKLAAEFVGTLETCENNRSYVTVKRGCITNWN